MCRHVGHTITGWGKDTAEYCHKQILAEQNGRKEQAARGRQGEAIRCWESCIAAVKAGASDSHLIHVWQDHPSLPHVVLLLADCMMLPDAGLTSGFDQHTYNYWPTQAEWLRSITNSIVSCVSDCHPQTPDYITLIEQRIYMRGVQLYVKVYTLNSSMYSFVWTDQSRFDQWTVTL